MNAPARLHYAITGGGLAGRLIALRLARSGQRVSLADRAGPEGSRAAAHVAAAMLAPLAESAVSEPLIVALGIASLTHWEALMATLAQPVFFQRQGTLVVWHRPDRDEATRFAARLHLPENAPAGIARRPLDAAGIAAIEPALGTRFAQGLMLDGEGQLDNRGLLAALAIELDRAGVALHWQTEAEPEAFAAQCGADWTIDCRGLGAKPDWRALRGVRGEVARVQTHDVTLRRPVRLLHPRYPIYIAPKPDGVFVVGATEIESEDDGPPTVRSALELLSALHSLHPAFGEARIIDIAANRRPTLPDHLPRIQLDAARRTLRVNGLYRHGFLIAPAVIHDAADALDALRAQREPAPRWPALFRADDAIRAAA